MTAETGSYRWMAPEVIRHEPYGTGCDVYSFGVLCWEMLSYSIPFPQHTPVEVALSVATKGVRPEIPAHSPRVLVDLIEQCWQQQALLRPSFAKVRRAPRRSRSRALTPVLALAALLAPTPPRPPPPRPGPGAASAVRRPPSQVCSRIDAIEGATALSELPGAEAGLIGERLVADNGSSVETLPVTGFEGAAASQASPPSSPTSDRASPGEKRKCSEARADSSQPGATLIVVNMGAGTPEACTSQSPHGSPKGAELKRPKSGVDLASLAHLLG